MADVTDKQLLDEIYSIIARCPDEPCQTCDDRARRTVTFILSREREAVTKELESLPIGKTPSEQLTVIQRRISELTSNTPKESV